MNKKVIVGIAILTAAVILILIAVINLSPSVSIPERFMDNTVNERILDSLRNGTMNISMVRDVKVLTKQSTIISIGIRNSQQTKNLTYVLEIKYSEVYAQNNQVAGFVFNQNPKELSPRESDVFYVRYNAGKDKGTTNYTVNIISNNSIYASANFSITVQ